MKYSILLSALLLLTFLSCTNNEEVESKNTESVSLVDYVNPLMGCDSKRSYHSWHDCSNSTVSKKLAICCSI